MAGSSLQLQLASSMRQVLENRDISRGQTGSGQTDQSRYIYRKRDHNLGW